MKKDYQPGEELIYQWRSHMGARNKKTGEYRYEGVFKRKVKFVGPDEEDPSLAVIVGKTSCGEIEMRKPWDSLTRIKEEVSA